MEHNIEVKEYIKIFKKRFLLILVITLIPAVLNGLRASKVIDTYQAQSTFIIESKIDPKGNMTPQDIAYVQSVVETYTPLLRTSGVGKRLQQKMKTDMPPQALTGSISMGVVGGPIMSMTATSTDPKIAQELANKAPEAFVEELKRFASITGVEFIEEAKLPVVPATSANPVNSAIKGAIIGVVLSIFVVFLLEYLDNKIVTPSDVRDTLGLPVIGVVPVNKKNTKKDKNKLQKDSK